VIQLIVSMAAVAFRLIMDLIRDESGKGIGAHWRAAVQRASSYAAVVGILEVLARYQPGLSAWATAAMGTIALTEIASGLIGTGIELPSNKGGGS